MNYRKYCEEFKHLSNTELAEIIHKKHPNNKLESIRSSIRYHRGAHGKTSRKTLKDNSLAIDYNSKLNLPEPQEKKDYTPQKIGGEKILVLADIHIPDQDNKSLQLAIEYGKSYEVDTIVLLGDTIDCKPISKFTNDPTTPRLSEEIKLTKQFLKFLRQEFPRSNIIWKDGNHESRMQSYLYRIAPEISDLPAMKLNHQLQLSDLGIEYVEDMQMLKAGKLILLHGHELKGCPSVNIAYNLFKKTRQNILFGHFHKPDTHVEVQRIDRSIHGSYSIGCLSNCQPDYNPFSGYMQGFAIVFIDRYNDFQVENKEIINGKVI